MGKTINLKVKNDKKNIFKTIKRCKLTNGLTVVTYLSVKALH